MSTTSCRVRQFNSVHVSVSVQPCVYQSCSLPRNEIDRRFSGNWLTEALLTHQRRCQWLPTRLHKSYGKKLVERNFKITHSATLKKRLRQPVNIFCIVCWWYLSDIDSVLRGWEQYDLTCLPCPVRCTAPPPLNAWLRRGVTECRVWHEEGRHDTHGLQTQGSEWQKFLWIPSKRNITVVQIVLKLTMVVYSKTFYLNRALYVSDFTLDPRPSFGPPPPLRKLQMFTEFTDSLLWRGRMNGGGIQRWNQGWN